MRIFVVTLLVAAGMAFSYILVHDSEAAGEPIVPGGVAGPYVPA